MNKNLIFFIFTTLAGCTTWQHPPPNVLKAFTSDGCSLSPNGTSTDPNALLKCCIHHDYAYWKGGTRDERAQADLELKACITDASSARLGEIYYRGVRIGGSNVFKTDFRWGYGWSRGRDDSPLTLEESAQVKTQTENIDWDAVFQELSR
ncbi:MAG: helicase [Bdellovibrio sp.]|nr:helicase [Bdellovibrio sp.]